MHGLWNIYGLDFRIDTLISVLSCLLPFLSFFVFLFVKTPKVWKSHLHAFIAVGYLAAYSHPQLAYLRGLRLLHDCCGNDR